MNNKDLKVIKSMRPKLSKIVPPLSDSHRSLLCFQARGGTFNLGGNMKRLLVTLLFVAVVSSAQAETASYYTYQSCVREGTSGVWTASGERFNENDLTAAMWGVKFGTLVRVTNLNNNKSVVVRINDRGPSRRLVKKGRVIDLSKGAFLSIASLRAGVVPVKVEVL